MCPPTPRCWFFILSLVVALLNVAPSHAGQSANAAWDNPPFGAGTDALAHAFKANCARLARIPAGRALHSNRVFGTAGQWHGICADVLRTPEHRLVEFINQRLTKVRMPTPDHYPTKFTGYFKPILKGSRTRQGPYQTPLVAKPANLVVCQGKSGIKLPGGGCRVGYPTRGEIEQALKRGDTNYRAIAWVEDAIGAYFMQIQGSGTVLLENGELLHVGFAAKNGRPYVAIGKVMRERGLLTMPINADKIAAWLRANPAQAPEILHTNPSYIFFAEHAEESPGAFGIALIPGRSLAVDRDYLPLGLPLLISTRTTHDDKPWRRIMFAHDVGSAIQGPTRGDIYFGHGAAAGTFAGDQNAPGTMYALVPRENVNLETVQLEADKVEPAAGVAR